MFWDFRVPKLPVCKETYVKQWTKPQYYEDKLSDYGNAFCDTTGDKSAIFSPYAKLFPDESKVMSKSEMLKETKDISVRRNHIYKGGNGLTKLKHPLTKPRREKCVKSYTTLLVCDD